MLLSIIIVNYYTENEILECLKSIVKQSIQDIEVIIVDNSSSINDEYDYGIPIKIVKPNRNLGFGRANNLGVDNSTGEFILFLNPDCELSTSSDLQNMIDAIQFDDSIGILAPAILEKNKMILPVKSYPKQKYLPDDYFVALTGSNAWVLGAVMMVRRSVFIDVGGFDKDFFLYAEETDLCLRYRQHGYNVAYLDKVIAKHIGGASEVSSDSYDYWLRKQRGLHLFIHKHYPPNICNKILSNERISSLMKLVLAKLKLCFGTKNQKLYDDIARYKAIYDSSNKTLSNIDWLYFKD